MICSSMMYKVKEKEVIPSLENLFPYFVAKLLLIGIIYIIFLIIYKITYI